jgi:hypothetical protein
MTTKITVERVSADEVRVTLVAEIRITGNFRRGLRGDLLLSLDAHDRVLHGPAAHVAV